MEMNPPQGQPAYQGQPIPQAQPDPLIREINFPLYQSKGWMMFLGILSILMGVFTALSIVGIVIAWLPIWIGVLLFQAANSTEEAHTLGNKVSLLKTLGKLKLFFTIMGVFYLINLAFIGISILAIFGLGMFGGLMEGLEGINVD
jgi:hypothetical protein